MSVVSRFLKGKWMEKVRDYASNPQKPVLSYKGKGEW